MTTDVHNLSFEHLNQREDIGTFFRNTIYLDAGGIRALEQAKQACDRRGVTIVLSGIHTQPYMLCEKTGMLDKLGKENVCANIDLALARARELLGEK